MTALCIMTWQWRVFKVCAFLLLEKKNNRKKITWVFEWYQNKVKNPSVLSEGPRICWLVSLAKRWDPLPPKWGCPGYRTKLHLIVRTLFWRCGDIYPCLPPSRIWHKVIFKSGGEGKSHTSRLVRSWSVLVIESLGATWTMLALAKSPGTKSGNLAGHRFTWPEGRVQCESLLVIKSTHPAWILDGPRCSRNLGRVEYSFIAIWLGGRVPLRDPCMDQKRSL